VLGMKMVSFTNLGKTRKVFGNTEVVVVVVVVFMGC